MSYEQTQTRYLRNNGAPQLKFLFPLLGSSSARYWHSLSKTVIISGTRISHLLCSGLWIRRPDADPVIRRYSDAVELLILFKFWGLNLFESLLSTTTTPFLQYRGYKRLMVLSLYRGVHVAGSKLHVNACWHGLLRICSRQRDVTLI